MVVCVCMGERERVIIFQQNIKVNYQTTCLWLRTAAPSENLRATKKQNRERERERERDRERERLME